jgi:hypothetical protein
MIKQIMMMINKINIFKEENVILHIMIITIKINLIKNLLLAIQVLKKITKITNITSNNNKLISNSKEITFSKEINFSIKSNKQHTVFIK